MRVDGRHRNGASQQRDRSPRDEDDLSLAVHVRRCFLARNRSVATPVISKTTVDASADDVASRIATCGRSTEVPELVTPSAGSTETLTQLSVDDRGGDGETGGTGVVGAGRHRN